MIIERDLSNLGSKDDATSAIECIISYFGQEYLSSKVNHRLAQLWFRPDRLATIELYILGKCLQNVGRENEKWLKELIRKIKKEPEKSHGLFTEIIYFGFFRMHNSRIEPAKKITLGMTFPHSSPMAVSSL